MSKLNEQGLAVLVEEINRSVNTKINETIGSVDTAILATKEELAQVDNKVEQAVEVVSQQGESIMENLSQITKVKENVELINSQKIDKSGGVFSGTIKAQNNTNYLTSQLRNVILSTSDPDINVGGNGDIWIKYKE